MKILICDDQTVIRDGLAMLIALEPDLTVIGQAKDGAEALEMIAKEKPDLVLMDIKMPVMNGINATRRLKIEYPEIKVLVLTTYDDDEWVSESIRAGASGYLLKDTSREDLIKAIRGTIAGKTYLDPSIAGKALQSSANFQTEPITDITSKLTERELAILCLLARGFSNTDIAGHLFLSEGTVRNYVSSILSKLNVADRTQAALLALKHGLNS